MYQLTMPSPPCTISPLHPCCSSDDEEGEQHAGHGRAKKKRRHNKHGGGSDISDDEVGAEAARRAQLQAERREAAMQKYGEALRAIDEQVCVCVCVRKGC